jgi:hypothetical protein
MYTAKKAFLASAMMAMGVAVSGGAVAQTVVNPVGAAELRGSITVDNTGVSGGGISNFTCEVVMQARLGEVTPTLGTPVERITGVQILNGGQGFLGGLGCPFVDVGNLPWEIEVDVPAAGDVTIHNVQFAVHPDFGQPGCATTNVVAAWADGNPNQSDPVSGATVTLTNENVGGCSVNGTLRVYMPLVGPTS